MSMRLVKKRDGKMSEFNKEKIVNAIYRAAMDSYGCNKEIDHVEKTQYDVDWQERCSVVADAVVETLKQKQEIECTVENIQDLIEIELMKVDGRVAKSYILYRNERSEARKVDEKKAHQVQFLTPELLSKYKHLPDPFPTELGKIVYYRTYSRPVETQNRRERWWETCARVVEYSSYLEREAIARKRAITDHDIKRLQDEAVELFDAIFNLKVFPSGRTLWTGNTLSSKMYPLSNFNCSLVTIDCYKKFSEIFSVLMLGTGVGLSVEKKYISKLPKINTQIELIQKDVKRVPKHERKEFSELRQKSDNMLEIVVGDSKFGWAMALEMFFQIVTQSQYSDIKFIVMNYDNVRPAGERLKTFGGYASGEQAIAQMFYKIGQLLAGRKSEGHWYKIKPIDALDIATIIAENVVSGGVRRSSEIVFCDPDDKEVIEAKSKLYFKDENDTWQVNGDLIHRTLSNNTILYKERPTKEQLSAQFQSMRYSGEPGFGNMAEMLRRRPDVQGGNPCQPKGEYILTKDGFRKIEEIVDTVTLNGKNYLSTPMFSTGRKEVFEVTLANNAKIRMTGNHKVTVGYDISTNTFKDVELKDLKPGDSVCVDYSPIFDAHIGNKAEYEKGIVAGWLLADGCFSKHHHDDDYSVEFCVGEKEFEYASQLEGLVVKHYDDNFQLKPHGQTKAALRGRVFKQSVVTQMKADLGIQGWNKFDNELYKKGKDFKLGVLRAIFTCDGSSSSNRIASLYSIDEKFLAGIQRILMEFGIYSDILINGKAKIYIAKDDKVRNNKTCWALNVHDVEFEKIGFLTEYKNKRMLVNINRKRSSRLVNRAKSMNKVLEHKRELVITSIESVGMHDVYDITVDEVHHYNTNGLVVHNCFEILLRDRGVCNLTEVNMMAFVRPDGSIDKDGLFKAQKLSAKIGYRMATTELEMHEWNLVNQEDMLTGCSITGVMDFVNASGISHEELAALLEEMRQVAKAEVNRLAKFLGTNESKLVTTIKPSGTISQLPTVSSGVHFSHAPYYIRRVRVNSNDPMAKALKKAGFVWHPENNQTLESHTTAVFEIPVKAPKGKTKYDVSAVEQLELYKLVMKHYVDHNASNTVHVRNDEWEQVEEWVYNNWDDVVGLTFLSLDDSFYQLMPYEEITEEKYNELSAALPTFNPTMLKEFESFVEEFDLGSDCEGGACPIR